MNKTKKKPQILKLKGKAIVFIDWANVYHWKLPENRKVDPVQAHRYLQGYKEIKNIKFYYGRDNNPKSKKFLKKMKGIGYHVITKEVKYIIVGKVADTVIRKRKCDFDIEVCMSVYKYLEKGFDSFIFFSGDGDFAALYNYLIAKGKHVVVIYEKGHLGKEVWEIKRGIFKTRYSYLIKK